MKLDVLPCLTIDYFTNSCLIRFIQNGKVGLASVVSTVASIILLMILGR
jgi:hypothetical protein